MGATWAGITAGVTAVGTACVPIMAAVEAAVGKTTLAVGIVAVAVVGDVPEVVEAACCALGTPRPLVMTPLAVAKAAGKGEAEAAGISMICMYEGRSTMTTQNDKQQ